MSTSDFFAVNPRLQSVGFAVFRVITGVIFIAHGYQKLFVYGLDGVQDGFTKMGAPFPMLTAPLVAGLEFFGGIALVVGLLTRVVALGLAVNMIAALFLVHLAAGFFMPSGYEFVLLLTAVCIAFVLGGGGRLSLDNVLARRLHARAS